MLGSFSNIPTDRMSSDMIERRLYSRDLATVPAVLTRPFFRTLPDAIIRPGSAEQVAEVLRQAMQQRIGITPRAAASTAFFNTVPVRGGMVLDVNDLRGIIDLDPARQVVRVLPATTWTELDDALRVKGFTVKSYPSSAVSATVGGWVSTQGHGIGSLRYGALGDQLISLQVVLPNGDLQTVYRESDPPLDWFVSAEGTLGVITEVELMVRQRPEAEAHHLFAFEDLNSLGLSVLSLSRSQPGPYTVFFADAGYLQLLARAGFSSLINLSEPAAKESGLLLVSFQGEQSQVNLGKSRLVRLPGRELPFEQALEEWNMRLFHLRAKRGGPSLLAAEMWMPLENLPHYLGAVKSLADRNRLIIGTYGLAVTPDQAMLMSIFPSDERHTVEYLAAIGFTRRLYHLGMRYGGRPYGVGLWNTAYLPRMFSRLQLAELKRLKSRLDPWGIMNPGKLYDTPFPLWPITFGPGAVILGAAYIALTKRRS